MVDDAVARIHTVGAEAGGVAVDIEVACHKKVIDLGKREWSDAKQRYAKAHGTKEVRLHK